MLCFPTEIKPIPLLHNVNAMNGGSLTENLMIDRIFSEDIGYQKVFMFVITGSLAN